PAPAARASSAYAPVFFFQAEDGIRDRNVTGVQTCALPISSVSDSRSAISFRVIASAVAVSAMRGTLGKRSASADRPIYSGRKSRSEERRVGKECGARGGGGGGSTAAGSVVVSCRLVGQERE